ncbi:Proline--tRNA ligase [uncultured archaeon]|nr:Proline--tRNA ligase [uncultured archaeon]
MGIEEVERIKQIFSDNQINVEYLVHEPVLTSEDAAKQRGFELKQGVKAILFTNQSDGWAIADVPADRQVNQKIIAEFLSWSKSKIRMATPEEVFEKTGCEIGSVPPFGHKEEIQIFVDEGVFDNQMSAFNIGLRTHSVKVKTEDLKVLLTNLGVVFGNFSKY